jgi:hypothetical protein
VGDDSLLKGRVKTLRKKKDEKKQFEDGKRSFLRGGCGSGFG